MRLYDDRETFYQWDLNQKIKSDRFNEGDEVHFGNGKSGEALVVVAYKYGDVIVADVPNILLQKAQKIFAYQYVKDGEREYTANETAFAVFSRPKPEDYVYTETEIKRIDKIVDEAIEKALANAPFVPRMAALGDTLAEEYLGNKYHRLYCERNKKDLDGDGELDERGTYARICVTEIPIPPPDPDIYADDADPTLLDAYNKKQYGEHISLNSIPLRTKQSDLRVPARTIEEAEALDPSNAKEFALSIAGAKKAFVQKIACPDKNRYVYTAIMNSKGESIVSLIKAGTNVPSTTEDLNVQPLVRRRLNGAVSTRKIPEADDDSASKYYVDTISNAILAGLDSIITAQNELLGG